MTQPESIAATAPAPSAASAGSANGWQRLPGRAHPLYILHAALWMSLTGFACGLVPTLALARHQGWHWLPLAILAGFTAGALYGNRRYVNTRWRFDADGFSLRRGRLWQSDTRVPGSRVQHLDLKRGPLERLLGLATLVIHTAGTRHSAVALSGLDMRDAERLRDRLARQTDDDEDDGA